MKDTSNNVANSRFGAGVNKLFIQTHTDGGASVRVATQEPQPLGQPPVPDLPGLATETSLRIESLGHSDSINLGGANNASVHAVVRTGAGNNHVILLQGANASKVLFGGAFIDGSHGHVGHKCSVCNE